MTLLRETRCENGQYEMSTIWYYYLLLLMKLKMKSIHCPSDDDDMLMLLLYYGGIVMRYVLTGYCAMVKYY